MTRFLDGPAAEVVLMLRRAPVFLRAVQGPTGKWDALDQLEDRPSADEKVVVYRLTTEPRWMHIRARKSGGTYRGGDYKLVDPQPTEATVRDEQAWRAWAIAADREQVGLKQAVESP